MSFREEPAKVKRALLERILKKGTALVRLAKHENVTLSWHAGLPLEIGDRGVQTTAHVGSIAVPLFFSWADVTSIEEAP